MILLHLRSYTGVVGGGLDEKFCYNNNRDKQEKRE